MVNVGADRPEASHSFKKIVKEAIAPPDSRANGGRLAGV